MKILGIDLAGKDINPTGICFLEDDRMNLFTIYTDEDILDCINEIEPDVIVIDAPLSLPKGRCCLEKECECADGGHFRQAEREIRQYGHVLPLTFQGMKMLTMRGVKISSKTKDNYDVIETHPRTSQNIVGFKDSLSGLSQFYKISYDSSEHELDAGVLALTGWLYKNNCSIELGDPDEGIIILPKSSACLDKLMVKHL
jgi:predicted nuclease with RNAse H fold